MSRRVRMGIALALAGGLVPALALAPQWSSRLLAAAARWPGGIGEWGARLLAGREDEPATHRALLLLASDGIESRTRAELARELLERRERRALPHVVRALNGPDAPLAATCSQLLAGFAGSGSSFAPDDPAERRASIVRDWNLWWRRQEVPVVSTSGTSGSSPPVPVETAAGSAPRETP